jgi:perosamine synthetase
LAKKIEKLRDCGRASKYLHDIIGYTSRLNTSNAAIGRIQLRHLDAWNERRRAIANSYHDALRGLQGISLPPMPGKGIEPVYHLYAIRCKDRDRLFEFLASKGIDCAVHYPTPIHLQPVIQQMYGYKEGAFPKSETLSKEMLSIPMFPSMKDDDVSRVIEEIQGFFRSKKDK